MNNQEKTKDLEKLHFDKFKKMTPDFPAGQIIHNDSPDFLIKQTEDMTLGIELCLIHLRPANNQSDKAPLQQQEGQIDKICRLAKDKFEANKYPNLNITLLATEFSPLRKKRIPHKAEELANSLYQQLPSKANLESLDQFKLSQLPEPFQNANIVILPENMKSRWQCSGAGFALLDCRKRIQEAIKEKTKKYHLYLKNCNRCWLLITTPTKPSGFIHPDEKSREHIYNSPFERTYFLDSNDNQLHLLKTTTFNPDSK